MSWRVLEGPEGERVPIVGQPREGFSGPGIALRWFQDAIGRDRNVLDARLGVDVVIRRDDGAAPCGSNVHIREEDAVVA